MEISIYRPRPLFFTMFHYVWGGVPQEAKRVLFWGWYKAKRGMDVLGGLKEMRKLQESDLFKVLEKPIPWGRFNICLLYTSPSPRDGLLSRMPSSA